MSKAAGAPTGQGALFPPSEPMPRSIPLDLDEELFSAVGSLRSSESADPVSSTLRAFEAEMSEKIRLQAIPDSPERRRSNKIRGNEGLTQRQQNAGAQKKPRTPNASKAQIEKEIADRRAEIAELEDRVIRQTTESATLRAENRELQDRLAAAEKRLIALESALTAVSQPPIVREEEKRPQRAAVDKPSKEATRVPFKLIDAEAILNAAQTRLREVEGNMAKVNTERMRLAAVSKHERRQQELLGQRKQFEAVQARAKASEKALAEARQQLLARFEEALPDDLRPSPSKIERALQVQLAEVQADRINREPKPSLAQSHPMPVERGPQLARASNTQAAAPARAEDVRAREAAKHRDALLAELEAERKSRVARPAEASPTRPTAMAAHAQQTAAAFSAEAKALARAEEANSALSERISRLEAALAAEKQGATAAIEEIKAALRREKMERLATEGALEIARKDFAKLMRKAMAMQRDKPADEPTTPPSTSKAA